MMNGRKQSTKKPRKDTKKTERNCLTKTMKNTERPFSVGLQTSLKKVLSSRWAAKDLMLSNSCAKWSAQQSLDKQPLEPSAATLLPLNPTLSQTRKNVQSVT